MKITSLFPLIVGLFLMTSCESETNLNTYTFDSDQPCVSVSRVKGGFLSQDIQIDVLVEDEIEGTINFTSATLEDKEDQFCACNETATQLILRIQAVDAAQLEYTFSDKSNPSP